MSLSVGEKRETYAWAASAARALQAELDRLSAAGSLTIPVEPGGWWHQYVCPVHHTELLFDEEELHPLAFQCPHGCRIEGEAYRGAWLVFKHQSLARSTLQAAAVYAGTKDETYARLGKRLLVEYAAQFPLYPVHPDAQSWMLKGRAFHQALTEAIWATTLLRAYLLLLDEGVAFTEEEDRTISVFLEMLATSMTEYRHILIHERGNAENNYTAWLNAALSCVYAARGQREELEGLIRDKGGFLHHLSIGVKPDQLEFEGSVYYHIFVLRAYLISAEMAERFAIDLYEAQGEQGQSLRGMFEALALLADDNGVLPALHDGPLERLPYAREIAEIMEQGLARYRLPLLVPILLEANRQMGAVEAGHWGLEGLLYGQGELEFELEQTSGGAEEAAAASALAPGGRDRRSVLWAESGFAVGRAAGSKLSFLADFGEHGGSHGHFDKLHVSLMHSAGALTPDLGMVPYGSALRKTWFAETASHNTVSIGGVSQTAHTGRCVRFEDSGQHVYAWLQSTEAYPGWRLDRHLLLTEGWLLDWYEVEAVDGQEADIEWWLHPVTPVAAAWTQASPQPESGGELQTYPLRIQDEEQRLPVTGTFAAPAADGSEGFAATASVRYEVAEGEAVTHTAVVGADQELLLVRTPGTSVDPSVPLTALLHKQHGTKAAFIHAFRACEDGCSLTALSGSRLELEASGKRWTISLSPDGELQWA
ncbi:Alginate lyase [Paenibacillus sp. UNCCL117]|uniref:heparinase II/III domain-containing protein n=1 Tax=unclassified Paenibacillus TaxID=185978 RepID=UPI00087F5013|nr:MULTISPECIES: heparinase II/III family protein [unclassified Paenibacillus]SDC78540.1 Alginate lyase [Paenibacillus sp. cl123]SFW26089.1 Alginate lyase [Paenibacillus sp. UNCCL117]